MTTGDGVIDNWVGPVGSKATAGEGMVWEVEAGIGELATSVRMGRGAVAPTGLAGIIA